MMYHSVPVESKPVTPVTHTDWQSQPLCSYNAPSRHVGHQASVFSWVSLFLSPSQTLSTKLALVSSFLQDSSKPGCYLAKVAHVFFPTGDEWNHCDRGMRHRRQQDGGSHWLPAGFLFCSRWYWFFIRKIKTGQPVLTWCQCCLLHPLLPTCRIWDTLASSWFVLGRHVSSEQCATGFCAYASIASTSSVISYSQTYLHNGRSWLRNVFDKKAERLHNNRLFCV